MKIISEKETVKKELKQPIKRIDIVNCCQKTVAAPELNWVSEFLENEIKTWRQGDYIFINCNTGTGKTHFVENYITNRPFRVLFLTNRVANRDQVKKHLGNCGSLLYSNTEIRSYQSLELDSECTIQYLNMFDFIIADEAHYLLSDSLFNPRVNVAKFKLMNTTKPVIVFMSATIKPIMHLITQECRDKLGDLETMRKIKSYEMKKSKLTLRNVFDVRDWSLVIEEIVRSNHKWLVFVDSKKEGNEILKTLPEGMAVFIDKDSSESSGEEKKAFDDLVKNECFNYKVLIATSVIDNGVNIIDTELKGIVVASTNKVEIVQMVGRKRPVDSDDYIDLYIMKQSVRKLFSLLRTFYNTRTFFYEYMKRLKESNRPDIIHMMNTKEGNMYRTAFYYDPVNNLYYPNALGIMELSNRINDITELIQSESTFHTKLNWLIENTDLTLQAILCNDNSGEFRTRKFMEAIDPYIGKSFEIKTEEWTNFQASFTEAFWRIYGKDTADKHRNNRVLSAKKISAVLEKNDIPLLLNKEGRCYQLMLI